MALPCTASLSRYLRRGDLERRGHLHFKATRKFRVKAPPPVREIVSFVARTVQLYSVCQIASHGWNNLASIPATLWNPSRLGTRFFKYSSDLSRDRLSLRSGITATTTTTTTRNLTISIPIPKRGIAFDPANVRVGSVIWNTHLARVPSSSVPPFVSHWSRKSVSFHRGPARIFTGELNLSREHCGEFPKCDEAQRLPTILCCFRGYRQTAGGFEKLDKNSSFPIKFSCFSFEDLRFFIYFSFSFFLLSSKISQYSHRFSELYASPLRASNYRDYLILNVEYSTTLEPSKFPDGYPS